MQEEIRKFFKGDVENSNETLEKYSHDASIFEVKPELVVFPKNRDDVKALVKWVGDNKQKYPNLSLTARSAGTCMSGGAINESIIIDFTRYMNKIYEVNNVAQYSIKTKNPINPQEIEISGTAVVEPGCYYRDFEKKTLEKNLLLPCYTASKSLNAMGGMVGNNSGGEKTLVYGKTEDYIKSLQVVLTDGQEYEVKPLTKDELLVKISQNNFEGNLYKEIYNLVIENKEDLEKAKPKVSKNSAGYYLWNVWDEEKQVFDLTKLIVGSQGTLGIVTKITLHLIEPKPFSKLVVVFLRDIKILPNLVSKILEHNPETLESYDDKTFLLVLKYIWSFVKLLGLKNFFRLMFSFGPEIKMTFCHGFPRLILLVEFTGNTKEEVDEKAKIAKRDLKNIKKIGVHITRNEFEAKKYWTIRHEAFNLIRYHLKKMKSEPFVDDVITKPEKLPEFYPELYKILGSYGKHMTFAVGGHSGDGNMHIYTLLNPKDPSLKNIILEASQKVYDLVIKLGGSITAEHNDGIIRSPYLRQMFGEKTYDLFEKTKKIFDPNNIFNPGKKVNATIKYIESHIKKQK